MTKKKNRFIRFILSFLPGAGEMYMGFMKMGLSLMSLFFCILATAIFLDLGPLLFIVAIVWFYGFFHVHNLASLSEEEFVAVEDEYIHLASQLFNLTKQYTKYYNKVMPMILIVIGITLIWHGIRNILWQCIPERIMWLINHIAYGMPKITVGIGIIILGIMMIKGKKQQLKDNEKLSIEKEAR